MTRNERYVLMGDADALLATGEPGARVSIYCSTCFSKAPTVEASKQAYIHIGYHPLFSLVVDAVAQHETKFHGGDHEDHPADV